MMFSYLKMLGVFILLELFFCFIMGFLNLLGVPSTLTTIFILTYNIIVFFMFGLKNGKKTSRKGLIEGLFTAGILLLTLFIISILFFTRNFSYFTIIYYLVLLLFTVFGALVGKNNKKESTSQDKK